MKNSSGYLLALFAGVSLGWIGQQFWFVGLDRYISASEQDFSRNEHRLKLLREKDSVFNQARDLDTLSEGREPLMLSASATDIEQAAFDLANQSVVSRSDFELILKYIELKLLQDEFQEALPYLYDLRLQLASDDESAYLKLIYDYVLRIELYLEGANRLEGLVALYRQLNSLQADYIPYYLSLSHWLIASDELDAAESTLIAAKHDMRYQGDVLALENTIEQLRDRFEQYVIPLQQVGEHFLAEFQFGDAQNLSLMLDTGASMTVIKHELMAEFLPGFMADAEILSLNTANGPVSGHKITLSSVNLGGLTIEGLEVGVISLPGFKYDGLLGMNVLSRFDFHIDQDNKQLLLSP